MSSCTFYPDGAERQIVENPHCVFTESVVPNRFKPCANFVVSAVEC